MYLSLPAYSLPVVGSVQLTLSCGTSHASIQVSINSPPSQGVLLVTPATGGIAMVTDYAMTASQWISSNLPLNYEFAFTLGLGQYASNQLVVQARSLTSSAQSKLPAPPASANKFVQCVVNVVDAYGASAIFNFFNL